MTFTQTRGNGGVFGAGRYVVGLPADVFTIAAPMTTFRLKSRTTHRVTHASVESSLLPK